MAVRARQARSSLPWSAVTSVLAEEDFAFGRIDQPIDQSQEGGFASARPADDPHHLAVGDR